MKRIILISMMALAVAAGAWGQTLSEFQSGFTAFSADMASTLSYNATVGNNWSDAYIGGFPHFGVGLAVGITAVPSARIEPFFDAMGVTVPDSLKTMGLPIPAAALSAKLGGFILPFDIGLKAMVLPESVASSLSASGITADYSLIGGNVRFAVLKENILLPDVSIGAGYNRLTGSVGVELPTGDETFTSAIGMITATAPSLSVDWSTNSFDFTLQVSKSLLFMRPYAGVGYSMGKSTVSGGLASTITYGGTEINQTQIDDINAALAAAGQATAEISADGIIFSAEDTTPVLRVYGGLSFEIFVIKLDTTVTYVPATKSLGASAMVRFQL
ncbi:MAG: hypothetical protein CVV51_13310 [Spirochaetae bacterium HGW-Spirochaetae-7]|jgi:hypothetical protein|nr:MAG: hypothetical protein CVV51_13310 [Spirochaetae bacterium HGW-Spirochaetae-7]